MKMGKIEKEDMPLVSLAYNKILDCVEALPKEIFDNEKFSLIVANALINLVCSFMNSCGATKPELIKGTEQVWNTKYGDTTLN